MIPGDRSVTVVRGAVNGRSGVWVEVSRHVIPGCLFARSSTAEQTGTEDTVEVNAVVYAPFDSDVTATDRVLLGAYPNAGDGADQQVYDVVGDPFPWQSPFTGAGLGVEFRLVEHR